MRVEREEVNGKINPITNRHTHKDGKCKSGFQIRTCHSRSIGINPVHIGHLFNLMKFKKSLHGFMISKRSTLFQEMEYNNKLEVLQKNPFCIHHLFKHYIRPCNAIK